MSKYNVESEKLKKVYFKPYEVLKSYLFSILISLLIVSVVLLPLFNIVFLKYYFKIILLIGIITVLLFIYLVLYFKDKALIMYNSDVKNVNLFYIRMVDMLFVTIFAIIIYIIYILIF